MSNLYLWLDDMGIVETFENVSDVFYDGRNLTFNSNHSDVQLKGVNAIPLIADSDVTITIENYEKYKLEQNNIDEDLDYESEYKKISSELEELKQLVKQIISSEEEPTN